MPSPKRKKCVALSYLFVDVECGLLLVYFHLKQFIFQREVLSKWLVVVVSVINPLSSLTFYHHLNVFFANFINTSKREVSAVCLSVRKSALLALGI